MIRLTTLLGLLCTAVCGCAPTDDVPLGYDQVVLLDVQGLWGGHDLWIDADGDVVCRVVEPPTRGEQTGLQETRYRFSLSSSQQDKLAELIEEHAFFSVTIKHRYGIPDEAHPILFVKSGDRQHAVGKWASDKYRRFDAIYEYLLELAEQAQPEHQNHQGPYVWDWQPEGFTTNLEIIKLGVPPVND